MYAVIVHAQPGNQAQEVVPQLVSLMDLHASTLHKMAERGFITVESGLSHEEGTFLVARLQALQLPVELISENDLSTRVDSPAIQPAPSSPTTGVPSVSLFEDMELDSLVHSLDFDPAVDVGNSELHAEDIHITTPPKPRAEEGGWGALFPDLNISPEPPARAVQPPMTPAPAPSFTPPSSTGNASNFGAEPASFGAEPIAPTPVTPPPSFTSSSLGLPGATSPASSPPPPQPMSSFQGGKILSAMGVSNEDEPPYKPEGFDDRPPHSPAIAKWVSILAPGAGQVYNGDEHRTLEFGLWFFLVKPWIKGVKQAHTQAEKISTHWAPMPKPGNIFRTLRYMLVWYFAVVMVCVMCVTLVQIGVSFFGRPPVPKRSPADVSLTVKDARLEMQAARIKALDAVGEVMDEAMAKRSEMSGQERVQRLFLRGLEDCQRGHFPLCEETMRRVNEIANGSHRDALRLQTWAAMRRQGGSRAPMPEVSTPANSLAEYELLSHQKNNQKQASDTEGTPAERDVPGEDSQEQGVESP